MLIGEPGARKSTAIKLLKKTLTGAGYTAIAANKTTKEKFILDLSEQSVNGSLASGESSFLDQNVWGSDLDFIPPAELTILADEFNNFIGNGNIEFLSLLGEFWDYDGIYENRLKNGKSVKIKDPTISILGGNTIENLSIGFPAESLGQGFFSRIIFVYGERTSARLSFPTPPSEEETAKIGNALQKIKVSCIGAAGLTAGARTLLDTIYTKWQDLGDNRFKSYSNRRFTHLLKLCVITTASRYGKEIQERDVIYANTILTYTELFMPRALGEFGRGKFSSMTQKVLDCFDGAPGVITFKDIWEKLYRDFSREDELVGVIRGLIMADKIQTVAGGLLPKRIVRDNEYRGLVDYSLLTDEERSKLPW